MVHKELSDYILEQLQSGYSEHEILERLIELGYPKSIVHEAHQHAKRRHGIPSNALPPAPPKGMVVPKTLLAPSEEFSPAGKKVTETEPAAKILPLLQGWFRSLIKPGVVFEAEKANVKWVEFGVRNMLVAGVIAGLILSLTALFNNAGTTLTLFGGSGPLASIFSFAESTSWTANAMVFAKIMWSAPLYSFLLWLFTSSVLYLSALIFGGKGTFVKHSYFISIFLSATVILAAVILVIPSTCTISLGLFVLAFFTLFPLTSAMKSAHELSIVKTLLIWLVPLVIALLIAFPMFKGYLGLLKDVCFTFA